MKVTEEKIKDFVDRAYRIACEHGFHDEDKSAEHFLMLVLSEIGEMVEADRKNRGADIQGYEHSSMSFIRTFETYIKDSISDELADVVIRLFDFCGTIGYQPIIAESYDLFRHSHGKKTVCEQCFYMSMSVMRIIDRGVVFPDNISVALSFCFAFAEFHNIDLLWHIEKKMDYNASRVKLHGKKY